MEEVEYKYYQTLNKIDVHVYFSNEKHLKGTTSVKQNNWKRQSIYF